MKVFALAAILAVTFSASAQLPAVQPKAEQTPNRTTISKDFARLLMKAVLAAEAYPGFQSVGTEAGKLRFAEAKDAAMSEAELEADKDVRKYETWLISTRLDQVKIKFEICHMSPSASCSDAIAYSASFKDDIRKATAVDNK